MTGKEVGELYTRLAFQYESLIDSLLARRIIDTDLATITPAVKDRKVPSGGKSRRREADDAAIFA